MCVWEWILVKRQCYHPLPLFSIFYVITKKTKKTHRNKRVCHKNVERDWGDHSRLTDLWPTPPPTHTGWERGRIVWMHIITCTLDRLKKMAHNCLRLSPMETIPVLLHSDKELVPWTACRNLMSLHSFRRVRVAGILKGKKLCISETEPQPSCELASGRRMP